MNKSTSHYPKLGGTLGQACQRLAHGLKALGAIIALKHPKPQPMEISISFSPSIRFGSEEFRRLTAKILDGCYDKNLQTPNKACLMLAVATQAESVFLFVIDKEGAVNVGVDKPQTRELVAALTVSIANDFEAMN